MHPQNFKLAFRTSIESKTEKYMKQMLIISSQRVINYKSSYQDKSDLDYS